MNNLENPENPQNPKLSKSEKNIIYQKEYYSKNKSKIIEKYLEKIKCELCGRSVCRYRMNSHLTTKLCINTQKNNKIIEERKKNL